MTLSWKAALDGATTLNRYGDNRLLLFALKLHQDIEDIDLVAAESLTDGHNDKKCDLVYINKETGKVIIAQGYWSHNADRREAPANKASDLNTACAWLLGTSYEGMPDTLRTAAEELAHALKKDEINAIDVWYVHNLGESTNVRRELTQVQAAADSLVRRNYPNTQIDVTASEVGSDTLEQWYLGTRVPILVTDTFSFETYGGFETQGQYWRAYSTSVSAHWLKEAYDTHGKNLFSANVRDYLGSRKSDKNINHNMKQTARHEPERFWVFNNGITALVNEFTATSQDNSGLLEIKGIAIVNGAQTTGAIGSLDGIDLSHALVPARFVQCDDPNIIEQIIRYNNSQNKIEASDFRSNDAIQTRLRQEFESLIDVHYYGGRRGGSQDTIQRTKGVLSSYSVGQALAAFHQEPAVAYNQRSNIWQSDTLYSKVFHEHTTARHILFTYTLLKTIEEKKSTLRVADLTQAQKRQWETFRQRGSIFLMTAAVAASLETILARPIPNKFALRFTTDYTIPQAVAIWQPIVDISTQFVHEMSDSLRTGNLHNRTKVTKGINTFVALIAAVAGSNEELFNAFAQNVTFAQS